ncbi:MAG TPA: helix-turn-helix transcriptional regulator [Chloroflexota bacterium]|nr:helix-turn-helix transcriptional regulator [Chloroflexota bacterium]
MTERQGQGGTPAPFGQLLRELRVARGVSQATLAGRAGVDRSYVNRLETGERGAPAAAVLEALIAGLQVTEAEAERLRGAAGVLPRALQALGPADPTLLRLAERLVDPTLSQGARDALRATVEAIVRHWSEAGHD